MSKRYRVPHLPLGVKTTQSLHPGLLPPQTTHLNNTKTLRRETMNLLGCKLLMTKIIKCTSHGLRDYETIMTQAQDYFGPNLSVLFSALVIIQYGFLTNCRPRKLGHGVGRATILYRPYNITILFTNSIMTLTNHLRPLMRTPNLLLIVMSDSLERDSSHKRPDKSNSRPAIHPLSFTGSMSSVQ
jgi:hypothetical protein